MDAIVSIIPEIKSWFPLIALVIACLAFLVRRAMIKDTSLIELASAEDRAKLVEKHFKGRAVNLDNLTPEQQYEYALRDLKGRQKGLTYMFVIGLVAIGLSSIVFYMQGEMELEGEALAIQASEIEQKNERPPRPEDFEDGKPPRHDDDRKGNKPPRHHDDKDRPPRRDDEKDDDRPPRPGDDDRPPRPEDEEDESRE